MQGVSTKDQGFAAMGGQSTQAYGGQLGQMGPGEAACAYLRQYAHERPEAAALWAFSIGFVLGWKLRIF